MYLDSGVNEGRKYDELKLPTASWIHTPDLCHVTREYRQYETPRDASSLTNKQLGLILDQQQLACTVASASNASLGPQAPPVGRARNGS